MVVSSGFCHRKKEKKKSNFRLSVKTPKQRNSFSEIRQCKKYPGKPKGSILICSSCLLSNDLSLIGGGAENKAGRRGHLEQMMGELEKTKPLKTTESLWGDHVSSHVSSSWSVEAFSKSKLETKFPGSCSMSIFHAVLETT